MYSSVVRPTILSTDLVVYLSQYFFACENGWLSGTSSYTKYRPSSLVVLVLYCLYKLYGSVARPTILSTTQQSRSSSCLMPVDNVWISGTSYYTKYKPTSLVVLVLYCLYTNYGSAVRLTLLSTDLVVQLFQFSTAWRQCIAHSYALLY